MFKFSAFVSASGVQTLSTPLTAAIAKICPLKVPRCGALPSETGFINSVLPPKAASGMPPPIDLARQIRSGITPSLCDAPCGPAVKPVLTSSKISTILY